VVAVVNVWNGTAGPGMVPGDALLNSAGVRLYPASDGGRPPRAVVFFFGNDVGFWAPHRELATFLSQRGIAVAGFDLRDLVHSLPASPVARQNAFVARITPIIERSRSALGGERVPLIIAGHSLGAEIAIWTAAEAFPDSAFSVLAMSPGSRSHLDATLGDMLNGPEPTGSGSFSVAEVLCDVPHEARIALVRGTNDRYRRVDSLLVMAGGERLRRFLIPLSGHSLKGGYVVNSYVTRAIEWLLGGRASLVAAPGRRTESGSAAG
jgi:hypothetical protein